MLLQMPSRALVWCGVSRKRSGGAISDAFVRYSLYSLYSYKRTNSDVLLRSCVRLGALVSLCLPSRALRWGGALRLGGARGPDAKLLLREMRAETSWSTPCWE